MPSPEAGVQACVSRINPDGRHLIDFLQVAVDWNDLIKPWYDVCLPNSTVEQNVGEVMSALTVEDVGPTGFVLILPIRRSALTRPFFRMSQGSDEWVYSFDILTRSPRPGPDPAYANGMLARNRRLFERARELGATRYPIGRWRQPRRLGAQYGELWR